MRIQVECYSGYRGEETPRAIRMGERRIGVERMLDRWLAPEHRYFKFTGDDGGTYIIRHDVSSLDWTLIYFRGRDPAAGRTMKKTEGTS
jgi:hypothetical protein